MTRLGPGGILRQDPYEFPGPSRGLVPWNDLRRPARRALTAFLRWLRWTEGARTTDAGKVSVSDHDENDPFGETQDAPEPLAAFEAFRPQAAKEDAPTEPFPAEYLSEPTAVLQTTQGEPAGQYSAGDGGYAAPVPSPQPAPAFAAPTSAGQRHGRKRSLLIFGGVAAVVVALGAGAYAVTQPSGGGQTSASSPATSATPTPGAKGVKVATARLKVTTVATDSFTATSANGTAVTVRILPTTRFGTAARPFSREQLVAGADVVARLRRQADGTVVATVIAAADHASASASASASAGA